LSLSYQMFPISIPSKGAGGRTGNWRVVRPIVHHEKCVNCKACYLWCPEGTILVIDGKVDIDYTYCKGCGICSNICPVKAIEMVKEFDE